MNQEVQYHFLQSALAVDNTILSNVEFFEWLENRRNTTEHIVNQIPFSEMKQWSFDDSTGNLVHSSGKFFSIEGINVETNSGTTKNWSQPIINQPEIGLLGVITKKINGILYFLMQAKNEPGNINKVQISPTVQATKSNYTKVHKGGAAPYLEYFFNDKENVSVLLDQLQSEQGARFLKKRNRNIIVEITEDIEIEENFCWLTLGQIKEFLTLDNVINMDSRTVVSGISYGDSEVLKELDCKLISDYSFGLLQSELDTKNSLNTTEEIISWITRLKAFSELEVEKIALNKVHNWVKDEYKIYHQDAKYFEVIAVKAEIGDREVDSWTQPLVKSTQEGLIAFIIKKINGVYHFLVQAKMEPGNFDIIELAPTVQCLTGNYRKGQNEYEVEFIDYVLNPEDYGAKVHYSTFQSEEGGRFYQEQNKNMIIEVFDDFEIKVPDKYNWMTLNQIKTFIKFNNYLNIQARSLLSAIKFT